LQQAHTTHSEASQGLFPGRAVAACFALVAFSVAVLAGLAAGNDAITVLLRSLVIMVACYPLGLLVSCLVDVVVGGDRRSLEVNDQPQQSDGEDGTTQEVTASA
jgi:hypothetical protein